jgi:hypothetical protein
MLSLPFFKFLIIVFYKIYAAVSTSVQVGAVPVFTWFQIKVLALFKEEVNANPVKVTLANPLAVMLPTLADIAIPVTSIKDSAFKVPNPRPAPKPFQ